MIVEVNNGGFIRIERKDGGVLVTSYDYYGNVERRDRFDNGDIVMVLNLLRYMKDEDYKSVLPCLEDTMYSFKIFQ